MTINEPILTNNNSNKTKINFHIKSKNLENTLWYEVDIKYKDLITHSCDAALIALLLPAMHENEDIHVNGSVSEKLIFNIYRIQNLIKNLVPALNIIKITYKEFTTPKFDAQYNATGFSAGIDAFTTLNDYFYNCDLDSHKLTHLIYLNVGTHIIGDYKTEYEEQKKLFDKRFERINKIVSTLGGSGIPFIKVDSNIDRFYTSKDIDIGNTYPIRILSVSLLLQKGIKNFYFSSGYSYKDIATRKPIVINDVFLPSLLSTESLNTVTVGGEYTRVEKTLKVAKLKDAKQYLDVCIDSNDGTNCSKCVKCLRTQLTLDLAGKLEDFSSVFDLDTYHQHKAKYINNLTLAMSPFSSEILDYVKNLNKKNKSIEIDQLMEATSSSETLNLFVDKLYDQAKEYHKSKRLKESVALYKIIVSINPNHVGANHILTLLEQLYRS